MSIELEQKQGLIAGDGLLPVKMAQHAKENGFDQKTSTLCLLVSWAISAIFIFLGVKI